VPSSNVTSKNAHWRSARLAVIDQKTHARLRYSTRKALATISTWQCVAVSITYLYSCRASLLLYAVFCAKLSSTLQNWLGVRISVAPYVILFICALPTWFACTLAAYSCKFVCSK
jgi:hypothetical protein